MKRIQIKMPIAILMLTILLTSCGKETPPLSIADYELNIENNTTSKGIGIGDTSEAFLEAYGGYNIETSIAGKPYQSLAAEDIPFSEPIDTILPTFFIDGVPVTIEQVCTENEIERTEFLSLISSESYLNEHRVLYYYLIFSWENGAITDIHSEYMDYNEDASYYEDLEGGPKE